MNEQPQQLAYSMAFINVAEAHYAQRSDHEQREIMIGDYQEGGGGTRGEFAIRWHKLNDGKPPAPRLEVFDDAWAVFAEQQPLIQKLAKLDSMNATPEKVIAILKELGFRDCTPYTRPEGRTP